MNSAVFVALRRLRAPIVLLVVIFAVGIVGLALIPGTDATGRPWRMSIFDALYFMSYTASTIGFGEIPQVFNIAQRVWVTMVIYASVVGWAYAVASLLTLVQDRSFHAALVAGRFRRQVRALREPFYLVCGFGETGALVGSALDALGIRFVVLDLSEDRVQELDLLDLGRDAPAMVANARTPEHLVAAGLTRRECSGVLALTSDDQVNLAVAIAVRLLNPSVPVLARAMSREAAANMISFGADQVVNPFAKFGDYLAVAIQSPGSHRLMSWLTGLPGTTLRPETAPPRGRWIVCGYGRFGTEVTRAFRGQNLDVTVIDPDETSLAGLGLVRGLGTDAEALRQAGVTHAVGIVAGTDDDVSNLAIAVTARELSPSIFTVLRQNLRANHALFDAYGADITMVSSEIIANECLALLQTPLLARFLEIVKQEDDAWADRAIDRIQDAIGAETPDLWRVALTASDAPACHEALGRADHAVTLADLVRDSGAREHRLECMPLLLVRGQAAAAMPDESTRLARGDELLFAGRPAARRTQRSTLMNINVLDYVVRGIDLPGGWIWQRLQGRRG
ncbi:MAG: NAD-binding protein [Steroidobacteraceae bacterium]